MVSLWQTSSSMLLSFPSLAPACLANHGLHSTAHVLTPPATAGKCGINLPRPTYGVHFDRAALEDKILAWARVWCPNISSTADNGISVYTCLKYDDPEPGNCRAVPDCMRTPWATTPLERRIHSLAVHTDDEEAVYAPRTIPSGLEWNLSSLKNFKLVVSGKSTPVSLLIVGRVTWNGMIVRSMSNSSPQRDLAKLRDLITWYSSNGAVWSSADGMNSMRASQMMSYREQNNPYMQAETFGQVYDARNGKVDVEEMPCLDPSFIMQHDVVLIEVSLGRFRDPKSKDWNKYHLSLELNAVYVLTQAPQGSVQECSPAKKICRLV
ncbi:hypothetical protein K488DRAFT_73970 [Vararia minispora EC-137]|uniref:Uncharacterized protein n=1 Tax=Vararia minispora EC-137 TaxID=1314806 RepID=A0ACB8Q8R8_9AGAM|nr:hypothetical protein K488DRAFT_73970 [Vararia minispora EC-137]